MRANGPASNQRGLTLMETATVIASFLVVTEVIARRLSISVEESVKGLAKESKALDNRLTKAF